MPVKPLGSNWDVNGCITSAGYVWCEILGKCLRSWEHACESRVRQSHDAPVHCIESSRETSLSACEPRCRLLCACKNKSSALICSSFSC